MAQNRNNELKLNFGKRLREIRKSILEYEDIKKLSADTGIPTENLYKYERGVALPPLDKFIVICEKLDITASYFLKPFMNISSVDKDLLEIFSKIKELKNDSDAWKIIKVMCIELKLYSIEKRKETAKDILNILDSIKNMLLRKRT